MKISTKLCKILFSIVLLIALFASCKKDDVAAPLIVAKATNAYSGEQVRGYFSLLCTISQTTPGFFPPQVSRAYGYIGITNYEAVVNGISGAQSLSGQLNGLTNSDLPKVSAGLSYNWAISSNAAIADMMRKMFADKISSINSARIDSIELSNLTSLSRGENNEVISRSVQFGKDISGSIYKYSTTDGGDKSYMDPFQLPFPLPIDTFCWVPTGAAQHPISPNWGSNRPFLSVNVSNTQPSAPIDFSIVPGSAFYKEAMDMYTQVKSNTADQVEITRYWADDPFNTCTPTGHTFNIMTQLLEENRATLEKTSVAYARLAIAENDAFISCWKGKYKYFLIRPVSYIKKYIDASFSTVIGTPPFPAYTSGHSCEMGAGSRVMISLFTDGSGNYQFTDYSQLRYGFAARNFSNFNEMADECAKSRFYGGLHYNMDNTRGLQVGRAIGDNVNKMINWPHNIK